MVSVAKRRGFAQLCYDMINLIINRFLLQSICDITYFDFGARLLHVSSDIKHFKLYVNRLHINFLFSSKKTRHFQDF